MWVAAQIIEGCLEEPQRLSGRIRQQHANVYHIGTYDQSNVHRLVASLHDKVFERS